jgi:hypothetical protein
MVDYATFTQRLRSLLVVSGDDGDWAAFLPAIIEASELRILRDLDPLIQRTYAISQFASDFDTAGNALISTPDDLLICRWVAVFLPSGTQQQRFPLARREETWLNDYWPDRSQTGIPAFYCLLSTSELLVAPTPNSPCIVEMGYVARPLLLSQFNQTSWVSYWYPDLLLYAAAVIGAGYIKNYGAGSDDPTQAMYWEARYQDSLGKAAVEEKRRRGAEWSDVSPTMPPRQTPAN